MAAMASSTCFCSSLSEVDEFSKFKDSPDERKLEVLRNLNREEIRKASISLECLLTRGESGLNEVNRILGEKKTGIIYISEKSRFFINNALPMPADDDIDSSEEESSDDEYSDGNDKLKRKDSIKVQEVKCGLAP